MRYAAFLRGINVGGNRLIKMEELARMFSGMGFSAVSTIIASGNVVFDSTEVEETLTTKIEQQLHEQLGYDVKILLRSIPYLQALVANNPFKDREKRFKLYVMFLAEPPTSSLTPPSLSEEDGLAIVSVTEREVYIVTFELPNGRSGNLTILEKTFGKYTTTRNWNTIVKIAREQ